MNSFIKWLLGGESNEKTQSIQQAQKEISQVTPSELDRLADVENKKDDVKSRTRIFQRQIWRILKCNTSAQVSQI